MRPNSTSGPLSPPTPRAAAFYYLGYTVYKIAEPKRPNDPGKRQAAELFARAYQIDPGFTPDWGVRGRS